VKAVRLRDDRTGTVRRLEVRERLVLALERLVSRRPQLGAARTRREPRPELELRESRLVFQFVQA
jgi:hypothetical protein